MALQLECYAWHYFLDHPQLPLIIGTTDLTIHEVDTKKLLDQHYLSPEIPNIFKYLLNVISGRPTATYPYIENVNLLSRNIVQVSLLMMMMMINLEPSNLN